ncbi:hypothetical protein [Candidatus Bealeia paramacronuclearis]|uniref:hypothetical protein n=1 Tax=Candidatus Bealeia paramacronuclearis TaxID=1921001 RepID=UPI002F26DB0B
MAAQNYITFSSTIEDVLNGLGFRRRTCCQANDNAICVTQEHFCSTTAPGGIENAPMQEEVFQNIMQEFSQNISTQYPEILFVINGVFETNVSSATDADQMKQFEKINTRNFFPALGRMLDGNLIATTAGVPPRSIPSSTLSMNPQTSIKNAAKEFPKVHPKQAIISDACAWTVVRSYFIKNGTQREGATKTFLYGSYGAPSWDANPTTDLFGTIDYLNLYAYTNVDYNSQPYMLLQNYTYPKANSNFKIYLNGSSKNIFMAKRNTLIADEYIGMNICYDGGEVWNLEDITNLHNNINNPIILQSDSKVPAQFFEHLFMENPNNLVLTPQGMDFPLTITVDVNAPVALSQDQKELLNFLSKGLVFADSTLPAIQPQTGAIYLCDDPTANRRVFRRKIIGINNYMSGPGHNYNMANITASLYTM